MYPTLPYLLWLNYPSHASYITHPPRRRHAALAFATAEERKEPTLQAWWAHSKKAPNCGSDYVLATGQGGRVEYGVGKRQPTLRSTSMSILWRLQSIPPPFGTREHEACTVPTRGTHDAVPNGRCPSDIYGAVFGERCFDRPPQT